MKNICLKPPSKKKYPILVNISLDSIHMLPVKTLFTLEMFVKFWFKTQNILSMLSVCPFLSFSSRPCFSSTGDRDPGLECSQPSQRCLRTVGQWGQEPVPSWLWGNGEQTSSLTPLTLSHSLTHTLSLTKDQLSGGFCVWPQGRGSFYCCQAFVRATQPAWVKRHCTGSWKGKVSAW